MRQTKLTATIFMAIMAIFTGCTSFPTPLKQVGQSKLNLITPKVKLIASRTPARQETHGIVVVVKPVKINSKVSYIINLVNPQYVPYSNPPIYDAVESFSPAIIYSPQQLTFDFLVENNTDNTLTIDPAIGFFVDSRQVKANGIDESIPPGNTQNVSITGPSSVEIFQGNKSGLILVKLRDIRYDPFHPSRSVSFKWYFKYKANIVKTNGPIYQRNVRLTGDQIQQMQGQTISKEGIEQILKQDAINAKKSAQ